MARLVSHSPTDTARLAGQIYDKYKDQIGKKALIIGLEGELGAGKTAFAKQFARLLGISDPVVSPTFTLHEEYSQLDHIDLWRIETPQELLDLGLKNMVARKRVIIIEWAEKARKEILSLKTQTALVWVKFEYSQAENERRIEYEDISH